MLFKILWMVLRMMLLLKGIRSRRRSRAQLIVVLTRRTQYSIPRWPLFPRGRKALDLVSPAVLARSDLVSIGRQISRFGRAPSLRQLQKSDLMTTGGASGLMINLWYHPGTNDPCSLQLVQLLQGPRRVSGCEGTSLLLRRLKEFRTVFVGLQKVSVTLSSIHAESRPQMHLSSGSAVQVEISCSMVARVNRALLQ